MEPEKKPETEFLSATIEKGLKQQLEIILIKKRITIKEWLKQQVEREIAEQSK